jgi:hypothetical protein
MAQITFTDVTGTEVWDLLVLVKMRIGRLEGMIVSKDVYTQIEKVEFERELEVQRGWERQLMAQYMTIDKQERFTASFEIAGL